MIVRWGLSELPAVLREAEAGRPLLLASERWADTDLSVEVSGTWTQVPTDRIAAVVTAANGAGGLLALGGGSAIDLAKAVSVETGLPVVSIPTTYAGAEWSTFFGIRDSARRIRGGGTGARLGGAVYEPRLTLSLPREVTGGTAMNALAHCAEALYVQGHNPRADAHALEGARLIARWLPPVLAAGNDLNARTRLLEGAMHGGAALGGSGLALAHALAQAVGGRYGIPHGAANAVCLPPALRFNLPVAVAEIERFGEALGVAGAEEAVLAVAKLAELAGFRRLRDLGVPAGELDEVAEAAAVRQGARANPRPASPAQLAELLRSVW